MAAADAREWREAERGAREEPRFDLECLPAPYTRHAE